MERYTRPLSMSPEFMLTPYFGGGILRSSRGSTPFDRSVLSQSGHHYQKRRELYRHQDGGNGKSVQFLRHRVTPPDAANPAVRGGRFEKAFERNCNAERLCVAIFPERTPRP